MNGNTKARLGRHRRSIIIEPVTLDTKPYSSRGYRIVGPVPTLGRHVRSWAERHAQGREPYGVGNPDLKPERREMLRDWAAFRARVERDADEMMDAAIRLAQRDELLPIDAVNVIATMRAASYSNRDIERFIFEVGETAEKARGHGG